MSRFVDCTIHQLFPAPTGLVVRYRITSAERMARQIADAVTPENPPEPAPEQLTLPVIAFATFDENVERRPNGPVTKVRRVEPLVYVSASVVDNVWPGSAVLDIPGDWGAILMCQFDEFWSEPARRTGDSPYFFDGLFLNGLPYSG